MDDFPFNLIKAIESFTSTVQLEVEQFVTDLSGEVGEAMDTAVDTLMLVSEEMAVQVQTTAVQVQATLDEEFEPFLTQLLAPLFNMPLEDFYGMSQSALQSPFLPPIAPAHPLCQTCRHYHGQSYGGTLLVCGMHPYGIADGQTDCSDHEAGTRPDPQNW
jgi:hypothetical protein